MVRYLAAWGLVIAVCWLGGCRRPYVPETEPTFPVTGVIHIDGKPTGGVQVFMYPADKPPEYIDPNTGAPHHAVTNPEGKFQITTYYANDGAPVGDYVLYLHWRGNPRIEPFAIPDELPVDPAAAPFNNKYANAARPQVTAKVEEDKPTDLGVLELTTR